MKAFIITIFHPSRLRVVQNLQHMLYTAAIPYQVIQGVPKDQIVPQDETSPVVCYSCGPGRVRTYRHGHRINNIRMKLGEIACTWSHLELYERLLVEPEDDCFYLIFEDDAAILDPITPGWVDTLPPLNSWDVLHLAESDWFPFKIDQCVHNGWYSIHKQFFNRNTAYCVNKNGAAKMLAYCESEVRTPADDVVSNTFLFRGLDVLVPKVPRFRESLETQSIVHGCLTDSLENCNP